ncbi:hypothetical protein SAMD00019534_067890, partial [Acytostelium subglobosum LB1]|uniref:hypothetical protein n=1 Tax=Acytostelium subglobosum LB1 TaxID=1410327 RepID=UPI00064522EE
SNSTIIHTIYNHYFINNNKHLVSQSVIQSVSVLITIRNRHPHHHCHHTQPHINTNPSIANTTTTTITTTTTLDHCHRTLQLCDCICPDLVTIHRSPSTAFIHSFIR